MNESARSSSHPPPSPDPPACPTCASTSTVTTAVHPDEASYWRCTKCGDVWNVSRAQSQRFGGHLWR
jgi:hypothetical protein